MKKPVSESNNDQLEDFDDEFDDGEMEVVYVTPGVAAESAEDEPPSLVERPNKTALKREMVALQKLAGRLLEFSEARLKPLGFNDKTNAALAEGRRLKKPDAIRRHLRYLAKLLSNEDTGAAQDFIDSIDSKHATNTRHFHQLELWRDRLIEEGDKALGELIKEKPEVDRQQLRQLIRKAKQEQLQQKPPAAARKLFKILRALYE